MGCIGGPPCCPGAMTIRKHKGSLSATGTGPAHSPGGAGPFPLVVWRASLAGGPFPAPAAAEDASPLAEAVHPAALDKGAGNATHVIEKAGPTQNSDISGLVHAAGLAGHTCMGGPRPGGGGRMGGPRGPGPMCGGWPCRLQQRGGCQAAAATSGPDAFGLVATKFRCTCFTG
jgi:hypothetical protein